MKKLRLLTVMGTRPEAIKLAPLVACFTADEAVEARVCATGQHREMLDEMLLMFGIEPHYNLDLMREGQDLTYVTSAVLGGLGPVIDDFHPDWVIVQGDTTSSLAASLAAFYRKVPVAHVEAGLRTGNMHAPWPEEMNRKLVTGLAALHFAPTESARANLLAEAVPPDRIFVTGNTIIDALIGMRERLRADCQLRARCEERFRATTDSPRRLLLVTGHRREHHDGGLHRICEGLARIAARGDVEIVYAVHPNPKVRSVASAQLGPVAHVTLVPPLSYPEFVYLLDRCSLVITDSGGVQEEAPSFGKPVLVTRNATERPEAVEAGAARLVGTDPDLLVLWTNRLLDTQNEYEKMSASSNPFGDGRASMRILEALRRADSR